jgi:hypothetical protein
MTPVAFLRHSDSIHRLALRISETVGRPIFLYVSASNADDAEILATLQNCDEIVMFDQQFRHALPITARLALVQFRADRGVGRGPRLFRLSGDAAIRCEAASWPSVGRRSTPFTEAGPAA